MTEPAGIEVEGLTKVFHDRKRGAVRAVSDVTFACRPGRVFGLLGPNGAGKTTTLRILSTVLAPTAGRVRVAGADVAADPAAVRRRIGFLSGATGLYERLTAREMMLYFGRLHGVPESDLAERIAGLADWLRMGPFLDTLNGRLSAGQRQKVSLARAIVHDPPVLILDEPTSNLDVLVGRAVLDFIAAERARGRCILLSTHVMAEADRLCDDVGIMHGGRLLALGARDDLLSERRLASLEPLFFSLVDGEAP